MTARTLILLDQSAGVGEGRIVVAAGQGCQGLQCARRHDARNGAACQGLGANISILAMSSLRGAALDVLALLNGEGEVRPLEDLEAEVIRYAIVHYRGQMSEVARRLQIGRSTLYRKLEALGLNEGRGAANGEDEAVATARQPMKIA